MKHTRFVFKSLMLCNILQNTVRIMYLLRSGPEVLLLCEFIFVSVNTWPPVGAYPISCFLSSWVSRFVCYDPRLRFYVSRLYVCVCVYFQYRFISINLHNGTMLPQYLYVFSYVVLAFLWVRRIITVTNLWKQPPFKCLSTTCSRLRSLWMLCRDLWYAGSRFL
jgi:hypothetical protein